MEEAPDAKIAPNSYPIKATKNNVAGTVDDSNAFAPEDELFSL